MNSISLKSIKYESIRSIFANIADSEKISRASISEKTELSLVTVGKVADALIDMNIVCQAKEIRSQAGRRAGLLTVNPDMYAIIIDITSYDFRASILDLRLNMIKKIPYNSSREDRYDKNLKAFITDIVNSLDKTYRPENCFGVGISVPGHYNEESDSVNSPRIKELNSIKLMELVREFFPHAPILIESHINAAAKSNVTRIEDYVNKNIVYWYIASNNVCGAYIVNGELILGREHHACDFGKIIEQNGCSLEENIASCKSTEQIASVLTQSMHNIIRIMNPHIMIMEFDIPYEYDDIMPILKKNIIDAYSFTNEDFPIFYKACCKFRNSHRGLTMGLRDIWIKNLVFSDN